MQQIKVKTAEKIAKIQDPEQQKALAAEELRKAQEPKVPRKRAADRPPSPQAEPDGFRPCPAVAPAGRTAPPVARNGMSSKWVACVVLVQRPSDQSWGDVAQGVLRR
ncbi:hypothetical protein [Streptomyces sp. NBC_00572]|uniref:hypothetical protein n=1 Tax=Streptomyces sp. NBC_00572 TaxID=2903664 RepID=UPI002251838A|nr:hypothetical protein [Streptomyces sp. NBC_00572]MCX4985498.1 hypothetical protein [Streptomyces sp. NBC_00572]